MKTAGSIEIIGGKARRRSRGRVDHTLRFKTAEIIRAIVGQFEQGGTDGLENQQIFKAPRGAGGRRTQCPDSRGQAQGTIGRGQEKDVCGVRRTFPITTLGVDTPESSEPLGTKEKYWLPIGDELHLFKVGRPGTGGNWAEKIAAELAELLGLPHAHYDLAVCRGQKGVLSPRIVPEGGKLILGNESLSDIHADYPKDEIRQARAHTLGRIHALLIDPAVRLPPNRQPLGKAIATAYDLFLGYLLLDAWIANQDRHHENWGIIQHNRQRYLAPTFDHAASLGQNETDATREERLHTNDRGRHISTLWKKRVRPSTKTKPTKNPCRLWNCSKKRRPSRPKRSRSGWIDCSKSREMPARIFSSNTPLMK